MRLVDQSDNAELQLTDFGCLVVAAGDTLSLLSSVDFDMVVMRCPFHS